MKVERFAVSIQWGEGHHYFLRTDLAEINPAISLANSQEHILLQRQGKRGAKPTVHVWERVRSFAPAMKEMPPIKHRRFKGLPATQKPVKL